MENSIIKAHFKCKFSMVYKIIVCICTIFTILWLIPVELFRSREYVYLENIFGETSMCNFITGSGLKILLRSMIIISITIVTWIPVITMNISNKCFLELTAEGIEGSIKKLFSTASLRLPIAKVDSLFVKDSIFDKIRSGKTLVIRSTSGTIRFMCVQNADEFVAAANKAIEENKKANGTAPVAPAPVVQATSNADELKKYKDLLDSGVITQEEFDAKKKQLLGL